VRHSHRRLSNYWYASPSKGGRKRRKRPFLPDSNNQDGGSDTEGGRNGDRKNILEGGSRSVGGSPAGFSGQGLPGQHVRSSSAGGGGICSEPYERSSKDTRKLAVHYHKRVG
ncbi:hypothetical protein FHG87_003242, partial [Trinorchestia longiramus]